MKILSIGNFSGRGWDGSITDENHIADALEELGHEVRRLQRGNKVPFTQGMNGGYDFILIAQWDNYNIEWLEQAKKYFMCPLVYWAFDYQADGQEWHERLVKQADLYLSKRIADSKYPNWQWLSQDFAPNFLQPSARVTKDIDVLFTGSYLDWATERNETIKTVNDKYDLIVHSVNDWPFLERRPPVMDEELPELYARAKIILSIDHTLEAGYWSDRNSQIMACGGFVLSRYVPMMESRFHSHITYFFSVEDCIESIAYWLEAVEDREMIAAQALEWSPMYKAKEKAADLLNIVRNIL